MAALVSSATAVTVDRPEDDGIVDDCVPSGDENTRVVHQPSRAPTRDQLQTRAISRDLDGRSWSKPECVA